MNCVKCGSSNTELKSGVSKKNGKPWKRYKCNDCKEMNWVNVEKTTFKQQQQGEDYFKLINTKLEKILLILTRHFPMEPGLTGDQNTQKEEINF